MRFQTPLVKTTLIRRYKRFLMDVRLPDGREVTAHCPNTGPMTGLIDPETPVWVEPNDDPKKKLDFGARLVESGESLVVIDTSIANRVVGEALRAGQVPGLSGTIRAEVPYGENARADFLVSTGDQKTWVEVKSVTLSRTSRRAEFPDTVTTRGAKHLRVLTERAKAGDRAVLLYLIARNDCASFQVAGDIDPDYAQAAAVAKAAGVEFVAYGTQISQESIEFDPKPVRLT